MESEGNDRNGAGLDASRTGRGDLRARPEMARRTLVLAPHPDDDTLAAAGLLRWAASSGADVRVVYVTDGENNPWAQRVVERRARVRADDRRRWGARRRAEALASLARLGVAPSSAAFLGLPDQGLLHLLLTAPEELVAPLAHEIATFRPTLLLAPALADRHPDHGVTALAVRAALARMPAREHPLALAYVVHGPGADAEGAGHWTLPLDEGLRAAKHAALREHDSQLVWHRGAFLGRPWTRERFADERALPLEAASFPAGCALRTERGGWTFEMRSDLRDSLGRRELVVTALLHGTLAAARMPFPAEAPRGWNPGDGHGVTGTLGTGRRGAHLRASLAGPPPAVPSQWFVKVQLVRERRFGLMDRWPWLGVAVPVPFTDGVPREHATPHPAHAEPHGARAAALDPAHARL